MKRSVLLVCLSLSLLLTSCRDYTAAGRKADNKEKDTDLVSQAIEEEKNAVLNADVITNNGKKLAKEISSELNFDYSTDKDGAIELLSEHMKIELTSKNVKTIYFTIFEAYPLENEAVSSELFSVMKIVSDYLDISYNEDAIIENIRNVDRSDAHNNYDTDYSDNLYLFCNLWNDGSKDCIDFRIYPRG